MAFTVAASGEIQLRCSFDADAALPPLPRAGLHMRLPAACDTVQWLGRGPWECYPDRKASAMARSPPPPTPLPVRSYRPRRLLGIAYVAVPGN